MGPVRLGIVGCGVIGESHLQLAAQCPLASVVAVAGNRIWAKAVEPVIKRLL